MTRHLLIENELSTTEQNDVTIVIVISLNITVAVVRRLSEACVYLQNAK